MTHDEALRKLDLAQITQVQLSVLEAAVAALLKAHPNPGSVRKEFDILYERIHERSAPLAVTDAQAASVVAHHLKNEIFSAVK